MHNLCVYICNQTRRAYTKLRFFFSGWYAIFLFSVSSKCSSMYVSLFYKWKVATKYFLKYKGKTNDSFIAKTFMRKWLITKTLSAEISLWNNINTWKVWNNRFFFLQNLILESIFTFPISLFNPFFLQCHVYTVFPRK